MVGVLATFYISQYRQDFISHRDSRGQTVLHDAFRS